jgi:hypothetical protein
MKNESSHPLFFIHGKYFTDENEFWKFVKEWPKMPLDLIEFVKQMNMRVKEVEINMEINKEFTNQDAYRLLRLSTDWAVKEDE